MSGQTLILRNETENAPCSLFSVQPHNLKLDMALVKHILKKVKIVKINLYKEAINLPWGHVVIDVI